MEEKKKKRYKIPWILLLIDLVLVALLVGFLYFANVLMEKVEKAKEKESATQPPP